MPVKIHNKSYLTVAERISMFRNDHPEHTILTEILSIDDSRVLIQATIQDESGRTLSQGIAEEVRGSSNINKTSAVENCESSAIGRCLAFYKYSGDESIASADEVQRAIEQQTRTVESVLAHETDRDRVWRLFQQLGIKTEKGCQTEITAITGKKSKDLDAGDYEDIIANLQARLDDNPKDPAKQFEWGEDNEYY